MKKLFEDSGQFVGGVLVVTGKHCTYYGCVQTITQEGANLLVTFSFLAEEISSKHWRRARSDGYTMTLEKVSINHIMHPSGAPTFTTDIGETATFHPPGHKNIPNEWATFHKSELAHEKEHATS